MVEQRAETMDVLMAAYLADITAASWVDLTADKKVVEMEFEMDNLLVDWMDIIAVALLALN